MSPKSSLVKRKKSVKNPDPGRLDLIKQKIDLCYYNRATGTRSIVNRILFQCGEFSFEDIKKLIDKVNSQYQMSTKNTLKSYLFSIANKVKDLLDEEIYLFIKDFTKSREFSQNKSISKIGPLMQNFALCDDFFRWFITKNQKLALVFKTVVETGLRISEVKTIDLSGCLVDEEQTVKVDYLSPKGRGYRSITVRAQLYWALSILGDHPFSNLDITNYSSLLKYYIKKYNISKNKNFPSVSIHQIRHYHASLLLKRGVNLSLVSKRLGHSNPSITSKFYDDTQIEASQLITIGA